MIRILIIEDQVNTALTWMDVFTAIGYSVDCAYNGATALDILKNKKFDVILSDISMPGLSGFQIKEILNARGDRTPIIFISGYDVQANILKSRNVGAVSFLSKPISIKDLHGAVEKAIAYGKILNEHQKAIAKLIVRDETKQEIVLGESLVIGRAKSVDFNIPDRLVSGIHLSIVRVYKEYKEKIFYRAIDGYLGGKPGRNGTLLNGKRIDSYADLNNKDILKFPNGLEMEYINLEIVGGEDAREKTYTGEDD